MTHDIEMALFVCARHLKGLKNFGTTTTTPFQFSSRKNQTQSFNLFLSEV